MKFAHLLLLTSLLLSVCCHEFDTDQRLTPKSAVQTKVPPTTTFELLSPQRTGIQFVPIIRDEHRYNFMADPYIYNGGGVGVLDVNNDGLQDLFFTERLQSCQLYLNTGNLTFENISQKAGISNFSGLKTGVTIVDINADGWQDVYVCRTWLEPVPDRRNLLFVNNKDNTFSEKAAAYNLDDLSASQHANFFDYDLDGDLDCYIVNHPVDFKTINNLDFSGINARNQPPRNEWESDRLLQNQGNTFVDVTEKAGILNRAFGLSSFSADFNDDGWPDIFVGNDFVMPDFLFINNHNGTFTDQADQYFRHTSNHTMGVDVADLNKDGHQDVFTVDMLALPLTRRQRLMNTMQLTRDKQMQAKGYGRQVMRNVLQLSNGNQGFHEIGCLSNTFATDWSWAPLLADFDNDGWCDIFVSNGIQHDLNDLDFFVFTADSINNTGGINKNRFPDFNVFANKMPSEPVHNAVFHNTGTLQFQDVSDDWGFGQKGFSNGAAYSDLDNDGDLDLITNNLQAAPSIYENKAVGFNPNNWLQITCMGTPQNPFGIGAKVRLYGKTTESDGAEKLIFSQEMTNVRGFYSSVEPIFQVGMGAIKKIDRIEIDWAENKHQILYDIPVNQRIVLKFKEATPGKCPRNKISRKINFDAIGQQLGLVFTHRENTFEDFDHEKLLPYRLSQTGPCLAVGDLNGDGLQDVFIGGAAEQAGTIFIQTAAGQFAVLAQQAFDLDAKFEDTACAFWDVDDDNDLDVYVVSGGNEFAEASGNYQDRLYLNDGHANFTSATHTLPIESFSGSCVGICDVDNDGKAEIIVGGRGVPGRFPSVSESMILKKSGTVFKNITATIAPEFQKIGMVTDIQFGDLNSDGKVEMIVVGDWMTITVFQEMGGQWKNRTTDFSLDNYSGLWRCVTLADMDGDGDLDIIAGNMGLNARYHASEGAPMRLFANDFDHNGSLDPILTLAEDNAYRPVVQRDLLASQIPSIKKSFPRNTPYANAVITDIFSKKDLLDGYVLAASTLETQWFKNNGGKFAPEKLPDYAQFSPTEKILVTDVSLDGIPDLIILGNDRGIEIETYAMDASDGFVFPGTGNGTFERSPLRIGVTGDARDAFILEMPKGKKMMLVAQNNGPALLFNISAGK
jgi:hypothetical protein